MTQEITQKRELPTLTSTYTLTDERGGCLIAKCCIMRQGIHKLYVISNSESIMFIAQSIYLFNLVCMLCIFGRCFQTFLSNVLSQFVTGHICFCNQVVTYSICKLFLFWLYYLSIQRESLLNLSMLCTYESSWNTDFFEIFKATAHFVK